MPLSITLADNTKQKVGLNVLDADGQPFSSLPEGTTFNVNSTAPFIANFVKDEVPAVGDNGEVYAVTGDITTGKVGSAILEAVVTFGSDGASFTDTVAVAVSNSAAAAVGFATIGSAVSDSA